MLNFAYIIIYKHREKEELNVRETHSGTAMQSYGRCVIYGRLQRRASENPSQLKELKGNWVLNIGGYDCSKQGEFISNRLLPLLS